MKCRRYKIGLTRPKPRGRLARGRIVHSAVEGYREWQSSMGLALKELDFHLDKTDRLGIIFHRPLNADIDNLLGGLLDVLVKYQFIADDNANNVPFIISKVVKAPRNQGSTEIYIIPESTPEDFAKVVAALFG